MHKLKRHLPIIFLICIITLGTITRFAGLGDNPVGLVDDEAENGYDAYSLLLTGKDQWGDSWPIVSLRGFGDYRLPAYTYFSILPVKFFGLSPFAVRFPSALFGSLTILLVYCLAKELFSKSFEHTKLHTEMFALLSAFFLAISPWHIGLSRVATERVPSVFFITLGLLWLLKGREEPLWIYGGTMVFALSIFFYGPNLLLVPFLVICTIAIYRKFYIRATKTILLAALFFSLTTSPVLLSIGGNALGVRTNQVNLTNDTGIVDLVNEKRGSCKPIYSDFVCKLVFNKYSAFGTKFITNYINHFSPNLLSVYGTTTQYSVLPSRGLLYLIDYPMLFLALVVVFSSITPVKLLLIGFLLFSALPDSITSDGHYGRYFISFPAWPILISLGLTTILRYRKKWQPLLIFILILYFISLGSFLTEYWTFFPHRYSIYSHYGYKQLVDQLEANVKEYDKVIVSSGVNDAKQYIFYLFYTRYEPLIFQQRKDVEWGFDTNGWVWIKRIGKVYFLQMIPQFDLYNPPKDKQLIIISPKELPEELEVSFKFVIKDIKGDLIFVGVDAMDLVSSIKAMSTIGVSP